MFYSLFWVIPRHLNCISRRFGALYWFYLNRSCKQIIPAHTTYEDGTECYETSIHKIQTPGNNPKEIMQQFYVRYIKYRISIT